MPLAPTFVYGDDEIPPDDRAAYDAEYRAALAAMPVDAEWLETLLRVLQAPSDTEQTRMLVVAHDIGVELDTTDAARLAKLGVALEAAELTLVEAGYWFREHRETETVRVAYATAIAAAIDTENN